MIKGQLFSPGECRRGNQGGRVLQRVPQDAGREEGKSNFRCKCNENSGVWDTTIKVEVPCWVLVCPCRSCPPVVGLQVVLAAAMIALFKSLTARGYNILISAGQKCLRAAWRVCARKPNQNQTPSNWTLLVFAFLFLKHHFDHCWCYCSNSNSFHSS